MVLRPAATDSDPYVPPPFGGVPVGLSLAQYKVGAVCSSCRQLMLDPATSLRYALDDIGWKRTLGVLGRPVHLSAGTKRPIESTF